MEDFITEVVVGIMLLIVGGLGTKYLNRISKNVGLALNQIQDITKKILDLETKVTTHQEIIENIIRTKDIKDCIDDIIKDAYHYTKDDARVNQFVYALGETAKECTEWYFNADITAFTPKIIQTKYSVCANEFRNSLSDFPKEFQEEARYKLAKLSVEHTENIIKITFDERMNSKKKRFKIATESILHEMIGVIISAQSFLPKNKD